MTRLCFLLHHKRDPQDPTAHNISLPDDAEGVFTLAVAADKYGCADAIRMAGGILLSYLASSSVSEGMQIEAMLHLIATAYILEDSRLFALLTRRLAMDHTTRLSKVTTHPAMGASPQTVLRSSTRPVLAINNNDHGLSDCGGAANGRQ
jgi:hypothetical protein